MRNLDIELNSNKIPIELKKSYLKSQELYGKKNKPAYVNSEEFRLRFLRCELFDVHTAALRMTKYLNLVSELFGEYTLQRPIRISDFSKDELREFRKGRYQFLPYRDRAGPHGRRILSVFPDEEWEKMSPVLRTKIWLYLTYVVADDIEAQKHGIVLLIWFDSSWKNVSKIPMYSKQSSRVLTLGIRTSSVHVCSPDTPLHRFRRSIMMLRLGSEKSRVNLHIGKYVELRYILQSFGIPVGYIALSFTGKVKEKYVKEWIRTRQVIEDELLTTASKKSWATESQSQMIESPYLDDIIFRNGTSLLSHPGNVALRGFIAAKSLQEENKNKNTKKFVSEVINELKQGKITANEIDDGSTSTSGNNAAKSCRFLIWNEKGWWKQVKPENEEKEIRSKITRIVRDTRKLISAENQQKQQATATSESSIKSKLAASATTTANKLSGSKKKPIMLDPQHGGAFTFLQSKRQKLSVLDGDLDCVQQNCDVVDWFCSSG